MKTFHQPVAIFRKNEAPQYVTFGEPESLEMHLSAYSADAAFLRKWGKTIKASGGSYSSIRGGRDTRFVTMPLNEGTRATINEMMDTEFSFRGSQLVVVARTPGRLPSWVLVHTLTEDDGPDYVGSFVEMYEAALESAAARGIDGIEFGEPPVETPEQMRERIESRVEGRKIKVARLEQEIEKLKSENRQDRRALANLKGAAL